MLRGSSATRPVLRFLDNGPAAQASQAGSQAALSETRGMVSVWPETRKPQAAPTQPTWGLVRAGDVIGVWRRQQHARSKRQFGSRFQYGNSGVGIPHRLQTQRLGRRSRVFPHREGDVSAGTPGGPMTGTASGAPLMRLPIREFDDRTGLSDSVTVQYGFTMDSVSFLDRMNNFSRWHARFIRWARTANWRWCTRRERAAELRRAVRGRWRTSAGHRHAGAFSASLVRGGSRRSSVAEYDGELHAQVRVAQHGHQPLPIVRR